MSIRKLSWKTIGNDCDKLANQIKEQLPDYKEYNILGLSRGGLVPAVMLSHLLSIEKVFSLGYKSYLNQEQIVKEIYQVPSFEKLNKVIIMDDLADTGSSFIDTVGILESKEIKAACLYVKKQTLFRPDFFVKEFSQKTWLAFPWEPCNIE
jgi:hypoxanthine phosphoribosyltransferase